MALIAVGALVEAEKGPAVLPLAVVVGRVVLKDGVRLWHYGSRRRRGERGQGLRDELGHGLEVSWRA